MRPVIDPSAPLHVVQDCVEHLSCTVRIARELVDAGRRVDLTGLDGQMGFVCARALDLVPEQGREVRPSLIGLLAVVDALSVALASRAPPGG